MQHKYLPRHSKTGVFDKRTARACRDAKWYLGFAESKVVPTWTYELERILLRKQKRYPSQIRRAAERVTSNLPERALKIAIGYIGLGEVPPGSNHNAVTERWGIDGEWCLMFQSSCYLEAGSKVFESYKNTKSGPPHWMYCPYIQHDARHRAYGIHTVHLPSPGDLILYSWETPLAEPDHVGMFKEWHNRAAGEFVAIEGNVDNQVEPKIRQMSRVTDFIRVTS